MHKVTNGEYLENISSLFVVKNNENYNLRNNNIDYKLEKPKPNFFKKSISYSGVKIWNEVPVELKSNCLSLKPCFGTDLSVILKSAYHIMWCTV